MSVAYACISVGSDVTTGALVVAFLLLAFCFAYLDGVR